MKGDYDIIEIKKDNINLIKDLWEKNRIFHQNKTNNFSYQYSKYSMPPQNHYYPPVLNW